MVGVFSLLAYFIIGTCVAALERRGNESWEVTAIATAGALSGAYVGAKLGLYVAFGELLGLICSVAGAVVFVRIYRSQIVGTTMRNLTPDRSVLDRRRWEQYLRGRDLESPVNDGLL